MLEDCEILTFDPKEIARRVEESYRLRTKAHKLMLKADVLLDGILKEIYGETNTGRNKNK